MRIFNASNSAIFFLALSALSAGSPSALAAEPLPAIVVSPDKTGFVLTPGGQAFHPWGFNYDHDDAGRLLEDYWETEWPKVEADFAAMKKLGANVARIHLQFGKFMTASDRPNDAALDRLAKLVALAERERLYLDLTGLGCYHRADTPAWYDRLSEAERWQAQCVFWRAIAKKVGASPAIFCYDLMNEPISPAGKREGIDWLGAAYGESNFLQFISLDSRDRPRPEIARLWINQLVAAIREVDSKRLITVGLVDWSLDRPGLSSGFVPEKVAEKLDFLSVHIYPEQGKVKEALATLHGFQIGKPVVVEETFPLHCPADELEQFIDGAGREGSGWIGFYWGVSPDELRPRKDIPSAMMLSWLEMFQKRAAHSGRARD